MCQKYPSLYIDRVQDSRRRLAIGSVLDDRWKVEKVLGEGAFGAVYEVTDVTRPDKVFALKLESNATPTDASDLPKMLPLEVTVLRALRTNNAKYFPGYESCGQNEKFNYVVMGLVGKNVNQLRKSLPHKRFTIRSVLHLGHTSVLSLREIHEAGFLHRDLKPANMCIGRAPQDLRSVYILDWGMCRRYLNDQGKVHRPRIRAPFRGTPRYASAAAMNDTEQGRADDVWSWFFTVVELSVGKLPSDDEKGPNDMYQYLTWLAAKKNRMVYDPKIMCKGCPRECRQLYDYIRTLTYPDKPDYERIRGFLSDTMVRKNLTESRPLDWEPEAENSSATQDVPNSTMLGLSAT